MGIFNIFRKKNIQEEQSNSSKNKFNFVDPLSQKEETTLEDYTVCKSALNGILKKLEELGYYEEKIEEYRTKGIEIIEQKKKNKEPDEKIIDWLNFYIYGSAKNLMENDKQRLNRNLDYIESDERLSETEKKKQKLYEIKKFKYQHGLSIDLNKEIDAIIQGLINVGYYEQKVNEFREECKKIVEREKSNNESNLNILYKLEYFYDKKCSEYKELEKSLTKELEYVRSQPSHTQKDVSSVYESFNLKIGKPFDIEQIISENLERISIEGYGQSYLNQIKKEIHEKIEEWKIRKYKNSSILYSIEDYFDNKMKSISEEKERLRDEKQYIDNSKFSKSSMLYTSIFGRKIINERAEQRKSIIENRFRMEHGIDCYDELIDNYRKYLRTYGYADNVFEKLIEKVPEKNGRVLIEELEKIVSIATKSNDELITLLSENKSGLTKFSNAYYGSIEEKNNVSFPSVTK